MDYLLENIAILSTKGATFRCTLWGISRNKGLRRFNSSVVEDEGVLKMNCSPNKTPIEIIKEGTFGGTFFRDTCSDINDKRYKDSWKEFGQLKKINQIKKY